jgi:hypothetical protein
MTILTADKRSFNTRTSPAIHVGPSFKRPGPQRPLWRKRETLLQERIVQYTTVRAWVREVFTALLISVAVPRDE